MLMPLLPLLSLLLLLPLLPLLAMPLPPLLPPLPLPPLLPMPLLLRHLCLASSRRQERRLHDGHGMNAVCSWWAAARSAECGGM
jgi:hypothetical protein